MALKLLATNVLQKTVTASLASISQRYINTSSSPGLHTLMKGFHASSIQNDFLWSFSPGNRRILSLTEILCLKQPTNLDNEKSINLGVKIKKIYMPTISTNKTKIYDENFSNVKRFISDPLLRDCEMIDIPVPGRPLKKEAIRMINIRKRKMRIHKRKKLYKKMRFIWEKVYMRRVMRKELNFRNELVSQINEVEMFDPETYVKGIIHKLRYHKRPPTAKERWEAYRLLLKKKSNTKFLMPRFDEDFFKN